MKSLMFLCFVILINVSLADDIYLESKKVIKNVEVIQSDGLHMTIKTTKGNSRILESGIVHIEKKPFDPNIETTMIDYDPAALSFETRLKLDKEYNLAKTEMSNLKLLPISILSFALSYYFFDNASNIQDEIDNLDKMEFMGQDYLEKERSRFESEKTRNSVMGIICLTVGVVNTYISFKPVEVTVIDNRIGLSYKF